MEISIELISAKMKGNTKPRMGEPGKQHSKVKDCLVKRREWGQRSSSLGTALLITAAIYVIYYSSLPPVPFRWLQVRLITIHTSCTASS